MLLKGSNLDCSKLVDFPVLSLISVSSHLKKKVSLQ